MPIPAQSLLVVKNGSKMRGRCSALMPWPVSATVTRTSPSSGALVAMVSLPPPGMAARAFRISWMNASCSWTVLPRTCGVGVA